MFTKKAKSLPPEEWVMFKDETGEIVPAIVSEELWETANAVLRRRSDDVKNRQGICNHANLLTGKLICTCCGAAYYRKESVDKAGSKNSRWVCSGKIKNGAHSCGSFPIYEEELKPILLDLARDTKITTDTLINDYTEMFQATHSQTDLSKQIEAAQQRRDMILKKKSKLLEYNVCGKISDTDFIHMNKACADEIAEIDVQIEEMEQQEAHKDEFRKQIASLKAAMRAIEDAVSTGAITKDFVDDYIDKIFITPENNHTMQLEVRFFTGESTKLYFEKLKGRTGQLSKKMIEAYEQGLQ